MNSVNMGSALPVPGLQCGRQVFQFGQLVVADLGTLGHPGHEGRNRTLPGPFDEAAHGMAHYVVLLGRGRTAEHAAIDLPAPQVGLGAQALHHGQHGGARQTTRLTEHPRYFPRRDVALSSDVLQQGQLLITDALATHAFRPVTTHVASRA